MKKVLFIDRDGSLIYEPEDFQVDSFAKLKFLPGVITYLGKIARETEFELVMVQSGGLERRFTKKIFAVQNFIFKRLRARRRLFKTDRPQFAHENKRHANNTEMLTDIFRRYDLQNSFVSATRNDVRLAKNLGSKSDLSKSKL